MSAKSPGRVYRDAYAWAMTELKQSLHPWENTPWDELSAGDQFMWEDRADRALVEEAVKGAHAEVACLAAVNDPDEDDVMCPYLERKPL